MASVFPCGRQPGDNLGFKSVATDSVQIPSVAAVSGGGNPYSPSPSRDSLGRYCCIEDVPGYTRFKNRVRISLNLRSRSGIKELMMKLKVELDQVKSIVKKLEANELQVESVVGSADVPGSRLVQCVSVAENFGEFAEKQMNKHTDSKHIPTKEHSMSICESYGGKIGPVLKSCKNLLEKLMKHKYGWVFNVPVDAKRLGLHDYHKIIRKPMDLGTVKLRLNNNWYKSPRDFAEDVRLTFSNAITYNLKGEDVHAMADELSKIFEEKWRIIEAKQNVGKGIQKDDSSVISTPTSRESPALATPPAESKTLGRSESTTKHPPANHHWVLGKSDPITKPPKLQQKPTNAAHPDKKPKTMNLKNRDMTCEEKQKLSIDLQDLPPDKLNDVVKIIKKRNQGHFQNDNEIELDIGSVDSETLWELERFVADYKKSLIRNKRKADDNGQLGETVRDRLRGFWG